MLKELCEMAVKSSGKGKREDIRKERADMCKIMIPVGTSDFTEIRKEGFYYVDKSGMIAELMKTSGTKVTLITRPRRFGKTLGMSMLSAFFNIRQDSRELFEGLEISKQTRLCAEWMNQYPTLFLSLKSVDGLDFSGAYGRLTSVIAKTYKEHLYLLDSDKINPYDKEIFQRIAAKKPTPEEIKDSLFMLTRMLEAYYEKQVILLIDEYDVPLAKASEKGYYPEMLDMLKGLMQTFKDNSSLKFAVITGCLRIAKESIFTGTNNFVANTVSDTRLNEYFGFIQTELDRLLRDTGLTSHAAEMKAWYDGYHFGDLDVYCPWDVVNHVKNLLLDPSKKPLSYWKDSSDNAVIRSSIDYAGDAVTRKFETLLSGGYVIQSVEEDLTYDYLHSSEENLWSILYLTGYLTRVRTRELGNELIPKGSLALRIPNAEVKEIFESTIKKWFEDSSKAWKREELFAAVWNGEAEKVTSEMTRLLRKTISYHDYKEDFYHAFLAGIFAGAGYAVESNKEHGEGRCDVVVLDSAGDRAAVFEAKYSKELKNLTKDCDEAAAQIDERMYAEEFEEEYSQVVCYGIAFYKKRCMVRCKEL